ncbi:chromosome partitioning protein ParA [Halobacteriales archaeon QS_9_67_15]|nr:MAG: chromosome partitioning protein ParA [Halobacteriales archaeon QS_9_67_15]
MASSRPGPARICVTNAKGGTGKTTVAINVAGALGERSRDVLFVDLDPQGNATEGLGLLDEYDAAPPTLFDVLTDGDQRDRIGDLVVEHPEMDVVPSNIDMLQAERELTIADLVARATALAAVSDEYDYVVVDSPPFYGKLTDTGIFATRNILVPALTEASSERAIELLIDQMTALESQTGIAVDTLGVVANRVETTGEDETMLEWFETVFADDPVWRVRKRVALQRAFSAGQSLFEYDPSVDMADVFLSIGADLDRQFGYAEVTA